MVHPEPRVIICPTCRRVSPVPEGGILALPTNTVLVRLLEVTPGRHDRRAIQKALERGKLALEQMDNDMERISQALQDLTTQWKQTEEAVHSTADELIGRIKLQEQDLSNQIGDFFGQKQRILQDQQRNISTRFSSATVTVALTEDVLSRGDCAEMADKKSVICQKLAETAQGDINENNASDSTSEEMDFVPNALVQEAIENSGFGQLNLRSAGVRSAPIQSLGCMSFDCTGAGKTIHKFGRRGSKAGHFKNPGGVSSNEFGEIAVADYFNNRVQVFDEIGNFLFQFGQKGQKNGQFLCPSSLTYTKDNRLAVLDSKNYRVQIFDRAGNFLSKFGKHGCKPAEFGKAEDISVDDSGNFIVTEVDNQRVQVFRPDGTFYCQFGRCGTERFENPICTAYDSGEFYTTDSGNYCIKVFNRKGEYVRQFGREGSGIGEFKCPRGITVDRQRGNIIVCDSTNHCIHIFERRGTFLTKFETKKSPVSVSILKGRNLVVSSYYGNCVQIFTYAWSDYM